MSLHRLTLCSIAVGLSMAMHVASAVAVLDFKTVSPANCVPVGPGTTSAELTLTTNGLFNPGASNESVLCELPTDGDFGWSSSPGMSAKIQVFYRAGAIAGKVSCTAYTGSSVVNTAPLYGLTYNPPFQQAGTRQSFYIDLAEASGFSFTTAPPSNVLCVITPKAALGTIFFQEWVETHTSTP